MSAVCLPLVTLVAADLQGVALCFWTLGRIGSPIDADGWDCGSSNGFVDFVDCSSRLKISYSDKIPLKKISFFALNITTNFILHVFKVAKNIFAHLPSCKIAKVYVLTFL